MAVMSATERKRARTWLLRQLQEAGQDAGYSKAELDAVIDAIDDWCEANAASFNSALPVGFRTTAGAPLKALVLCAVAARRAGYAKTSED